MDSYKICLIQKISSYQSIPLLYILVYISNYSFRGKSIHCKIILEMASHFLVYDKLSRLIYIFRETNAKINNHSEFRNSCFQGNAYLLSYFFSNLSFEVMIIVIQGIHSLRCPPHMVKYDILSVFRNNFKHFLIKCTHRDIVDHVDISIQIVG